MKIVELGGHLTDHYDPTKKVLALSGEVYNGTSLAALGVAAHEAGHAIQHAESYAPLKIRNSIFWKFVKYFPDYGRKQQNR